MFVAGKSSRAPSLQPPNESLLVNHVPPLDPRSLGLPANAKVVTLPSATMASTSSSLPLYASSAPQPDLSLHAAHPVGGPTPTPTTSQATPIVPSTLSQVEVSPQAAQGHPSLAPFTAPGPTGITRPGGSSLLPNTFGGYLEVEAERSGHPPPLYYVQGRTPTSYSPSEEQQRFQQQYLQQQMQQQQIQQQQIQQQMQQQNDRFQHPLPPNARSNLRAVQGLIHHMSPGAPASGGYPPSTAADASRPVLALPFGQTPAHLAAPNSATGSAGHGYTAPHTLLPTSSPNTHTHAAGPSPTSSTATSIQATFPGTTPMRPGLPTTTLHRTPMGHSPGYPLPRPKGPTSLIQPSDQYQPPPASFPAFHGPTLYNAHRRPMTKRDLAWPLSHYKQHGVSPQRKGIT